MKGPCGLMVWVWRKMKADLGTGELRGGERHFSILVQILNETLPRAAWSTIGHGRTGPLRHDTPTQLHDRLSLALTLISVQSACGFVLSLVFLFAAPGFVGPASGVPVTAIRSVSVKNVRIRAFGVFARAVGTAVGVGTRALDRPDVPLVMSVVRTIFQLFLDLALVSTVHVRRFNPTIQTVATIELVCDLVGAGVGVLYFLFLVKKTSTQRGLDIRALKLFSYPSLRALFFAGRWTLAESAIRNAIYLWQMHGLASMGRAYDTAWGAFTTVRWGLVMVPVLALEATSNRFVGHRWGIYERRRTVRSTVRAPASWNDIRFVTTPALRSAGFVLLVEVPIFIALAARGAEAFARYLSHSDEAAKITGMMWKSIDWCYIFYAVSTQLGTILLASQPRWYLYQSFIANVCYALPWAVNLPRLIVSPDTAWKYRKWVVGGGMVFGFGVMVFMVGLWIVRLRGWRARRYL